MNPFLILNFWNKFFLGPQSWGTTCPTFGLRVRTIPSRSWAPSCGKGRRNGITSVSLKIIYKGIRTTRFRVTDTPTNNLFLSRRSSKFNFHTPKYLMFRSYVNRVWEKFKTIITQKSNLHFRFNACKMFEMNHKAWQRLGDAFNHRSINFLAWVCVMWGGF